MAQNITDQKVCWQICQINKCISKTYVKSCQDSTQCNFILCRIWVWDGSVSTCAAFSRLTAEALQVLPEKKIKNIYTIFKSCVFQQQPPRFGSTVVDTSPKWWPRGNISGLVSWKKKKKTRNVATSPAGEASATTDKSRAPAPREMEDTTTTVQLGSCSHRHVSSAKPLFYCETSWQVCAALMWCMSRFLALH